MKTENCGQAFIGALFMTAKNWKQPNVPWLTYGYTIWYVYTMKYYSAIKRNQLQVVFQHCWISDAFSWMKEVRHKRLHMQLFHSHGIRGRQVYKGSNQTSSCQWPGKAGGGGLGRGQRQLSAVMEPLYLDYKGAHTTIPNCQNSNCTLERVHFIRGNISKNLTFKKEKKNNKVMIDSMKKVYFTSASEN